MRILMWSELFRPYLGGAEQFAERLIGSLQRRGHEFLVVTSHDNLTLADHEMWDHIEIRRLPMRSAIRKCSPAEIHDLRRQIVEIKRTFNPHVIHVNAIGPSVFFHLRTERQWPAPSLVRLQQEVLPSQRDQSRGVLFHAMASANWVVACADAVLAQARRLAPAISASSSTVRNGISHISDQPVPLPAGTPHLACVGRLVPAKGFATAIAALALLIRRYPWLRLHIVGDGAERSALERQARDLGLGDAVRFFGWVTPKAVADVLKAAAIVVVPSCREGLPAVAVQAAAIGRPIVASAVGGVPEIVVHGKTGMLVPRDDAALLAEAIAELLNQPELARRLGHAGHERARSFFDWKACVDQYEALYHKLDRSR